MNIIEAVKSGKRFRVKSSPFGNENEWIDPEYPYTLLSMFDIKNENWEIALEPEKTITITQRELDIAYATITEEFKIRTNAALVASYLGKKLGL